LLFVLPIKTFEVTDFGKLYPAKVERAVYPATIQKVQNIIKNTHKNDVKVSITDTWHAQGGQFNASNSIGMV
jgi:hypothetical protein